MFTSTEYCFVTPTDTSQKIEDQFPMSEQQPVAERSEAYHGRHTLLLLREECSPIFQSSESTRHMPYSTHRNQTKNMMPGSSSDISSQLHGIPIPAPQLLASSPSASAGWVRNPAHLPVAISHTLIDGESIIVMAIRRPQEEAQVSNPTGERWVSGSDSDSWSCACG